MKKDRIIIDKTIVPYSFYILLGGENFEFTVSYNEKHDFFSVRLAKDGEVVCEGEPIVYGMPLFRDVYIAGKYPAVDIIPLDESGNHDTVTFENLGETVFLTIDNVGGDEVDSNIRQQ